MRLLHYLEIENFKRFGERQRIELDHPAVLIGPNNCGKTSAIQALALWSQAVRTMLITRLLFRFLFTVALTLLTVTALALPQGAKLDQPTHIKEPERGSNSSISPARNCLGYGQ